MIKKILVILIVILSIALIEEYNKKDHPVEIENPGGLAGEDVKHPLQITEMRKGEYPGSDIILEQNLNKGSNYKRYIASYRSDGLKIYGLLTVPDGEIPDGGWPAIIFNHGYIPPEIYSTTEKYVAYTDGFSKNGYVVFKPDYRGHGNSEGSPEGAYYSTAYTRDVLNAVSSVKKLNYVNPEKLGMWGHSMGGHITLRVMVTTSDIKAGVIWGGVVASYYDMANNWHRTQRWSPSNRERGISRPSRQNIIDKYGNFDENSQFWDSISPISYVSDISGPVQLHHGLSDATVPWQFSEKLKVALEEKAKPVEYYTYESGDHNLSGASFTPAINRSVEFFNKYLK